MWFVLTRLGFVQVFGAQPKIRQRGGKPRWGGAPLLHPFEPATVNRLGLCHWLKLDTPREARLETEDRGQTLRFMRHANDDLTVFRRYQPVISFCPLASDVSGMATVPPGEARWVIFQ